MSLQAEPFDLIKSGLKTVELRLYDEKRQRIQIGDEIVFSSADDLSEKLAALVTALHRYPDFRSLIDMVPVLQLGYKSKGEALSAVSRYYTQEQQEKYGVVGITISLIA